MEKISNHQCQDRPAEENVAWKESKTRLSVSMLNQNNQWERRYGSNHDMFVRRDKCGNVIDEVFTNNCAFLAVDTQTGLDFLVRFLSAEGDDVQIVCRDLLIFDFEFGSDKNQLVEEVQKINPLVAYSILKQFKFDCFLTNISDVLRYKVQSVTSWLKGLSSDAPGSLADIIVKMATGQIKNRTAFFDYLDILVQWVNANQQILNPEIVMRKVKIQIDEEGQEPRAVR